MTTIYIAGPMTGIKDYNFPAFHQAAQEWRAQGFTVINPAELDDKDVLPNGKAAHPWDYYLRRDIKYLADCDAIFMLKGWENSKGASLEHHIATTLGMELCYGR